MQRDRPFEVHPFFDEDTHTASYLVGDPTTRVAAVIDPVLDFDPASGTLATRSADAILAGVEAGGWKLAWILETHVHADHLSAAQHLRRATGAPVAIGAKIRAVQQIFRPIFDARDVSGDGAEFDHLFEDGETFSIGALEARVLHTPGHTPACVTYQIADALFVGDTLFMPDYGTARADFPGGSAATLYRSIQRILALPRRDADLPLPRLRCAGPHAFAWETTRRRRAREERARESGRERGRVREAADRARRDAERAAAPAALDPGEHARGPSPARRSERNAIPEDPAVRCGLRASSAVGPTRASGSRSAAALRPGAHCDPPAPTLRPCRVPAAPYSFPSDATGCCRGSSRPMPCSGSDWPCPRPSVRPGRSRTCS